jgi:hypothetical protein
MYGPEGLAYDRNLSRLFVTDSSNYRVLVFDVATSTITNGQTASYVLGQTTFGTDNYGTTQNSFDIPRGLTFDAEHNILFVSDLGNNRVMVFNVASSTISNGMNAMAVIGQADFVSYAASSSQSNLQSPWGMTYDPASSVMYLADTDNNRILNFKITRLSSSRLPIAYVGTPYSVPLSAEQSQGTGSFALVSNNSPLTFSGGALWGTALSSGVYQVISHYDDDWGASGIFAATSTLPVYVLNQPNIVSPVQSVVLSGRDTTAAATIAIPDIALAPSLMGPVSIDIPENVPTPTLNLSLSLTSNSSTASVGVPTPLYISARPGGLGVQAQIAASTIITAATSSWSGILNFPIIQATSSISIPSEFGSTTISAVVEFGAGGTPVTLSKAARLLFSNIS